MLVIFPETNNKTPSGTIIFRQHCLVRLSSKTTKFWGPSSGDGIAGRQLWTLGRNMIGSAACSPTGQVAVCGLFSIPDNDHWPENNFKETMAGWNMWIYSDVSGDRCGTFEPNVPGAHLRGPSDPILQMNIWVEETCIKHILDDLRSWYMELWWTMYVCNFDIEQASDLNWASWILTSKKKHQTYLC